MSNRCSTLQDLLACTQRALGEKWLSFPCPCFPKNSNLAIKVFTFLDRPSLTQWCKLYRYSIYYKILVCMGEDVDLSCVLSICSPLPTEDFFCHT